MPGEMGFDTGPYVNAALFCDQVIRGEDGANTIVRTIDTLKLEAVGPGSPNDVPPGFLRATLFISLRAGQARGRQTLEIALERPDASRVSSGEKSFNFPPGEAGGQNFILPMHIQVEMSGLYWANVYLNARLVTKVPLTVNYNFTRQPEPGRGQ